MRHSLILRLLAVSTVIAVCSIAATAWLAAVTVSRGIQQAQGESLANNAAVYRGLLDYAATNRTWADVAPVVQALSTQIDRRVTLTTQDGVIVADSAATAAAGAGAAAAAAPAAGPGPLPARPTAVVDPLAVDPAFATDAGSGTIDARVVGPFALTADERSNLERLAEKVQSCVVTYGDTGAISISPTGRPTVETSGPDIAGKCHTDLVNDVVTATEAAAIAQLEPTVNACLVAQGAMTIVLRPDLTWSSDAKTPSADEPAVTACLTTARQQQLAPYVPAAALLYISSTTSTPPARFDLSRANQRRIAVIAAAVLLVTVGATAAAGARMVRPLRSLTRAAQRTTHGDASVRVTTRGKDEIARLGAAFNEMSATRTEMEAQRKALISDVAHELRSPLTNIRGWLETTQDGLAEHTPELDRALLGEAVHLQRIVDDLQDLALSDAGRLRMHAQPVDVGRLLDEIRSAYSTQAAAQRVGLTVSAPDGLIVEADPMRSRQVIENLVTNALRHTPVGGTVTLTAHGEPGWVVIDVVDTGAGISAADLPHVFDRFWRADQSRSRASGGSGLGLAISSNLVRAQRGTLTATSSLGNGSTFTVRLPSL